MIKLPAIVIASSLINLFTCIFFICNMYVQIEDQTKRSDGASLGKILEEFPAQADVSYKTYQFNVTLSNKLPLDRPIPDTRHEECKSEFNDEMYPKVSIIIPVHNEAWSMLLRTLHSIISRTPERLLGEIILVDDDSEYDYLKSPLEHYCSNLDDKIIIIRNNEREGLIRSRIIAAQQAKYDVLVFLDGHVEVNVGWLPPLLSAIASNSQSIAVPLIDTIDPDTLKYTNWGYYVHGGMTWSMQFLWKFLPARLQNRRITDPIPSPTLLGCAIAIDKNYFFQLGSFDQGMRIWGGENIEISIRTWTCGGSINIIPCSRVGHLFRKLLPYSFPPNQGGSNIKHMNNQRLVDVWLDEFARFYYVTTKPRIINDEYQLVDRHRLRKRLRCKSFKWYLNNVLPELTVFKTNAKYYGQFMNYRGKLCMTSSNQSLGRYLRMVSCGWHNSTQDFSFNFDQSITNGEDNCLTASKQGYVTLEKCNPTSFKCNQRWNSTMQEGTLIMTEHGYKNVHEIYSVVDDCKTIVYLTQVSIKSEQIAGLLPMGDDISFGHQLWLMEYTLNWNNL